MADELNKPVNFEDKKSIQNPNMSNLLEKYLGDSGLKTNEGVDPNQLSDMEKIENENALKKVEELSDPKKVKENASSNIESLLKDTNTLDSFNKSGEKDKKGVVGYLGGATKYGADVFVEGLANTGVDILNYLKDIKVIGSEFNEFKQIDIPIVNDDEKHKFTTGQRLLGEIGSILAGTIGGGKIIGTFKRARRAKTLAQKSFVSAEMMGLGGLVDALFIPTDQNNVANILQEFPAVRNAVFESLAIEEDDPMYEVRMKNFFVGAGLVGVTDQTINAAVKGVKLIRQALKAQNSKPSKILQNSVDGKTGDDILSQKPKEVDSKTVKDGDKNKEVLKKVEDKLEQGKIIENSKSLKEAEIKLGVFDTKKRVKKAIDESSSMNAGVDSEVLANKYLSLVPSHVPETSLDISEQRIKRLLRQGQHEDSVAGTSKAGSKSIPLSDPKNPQYIQLASGSKLISKGIKDHIGLEIPDGKIQQWISKDLENIPIKKGKDVVYASGDVHNFEQKLLPSLSKRIKKEYDVDVRPSEIRKILDEDISKQKAKSGKPLITPPPKRVGSIIHNVKQIDPHKLDQSTIKLSSALNDIMGMRRVEIKNLREQIAEGIVRGQDPDSLDLNLIKNLHEAAPSLSPSALYKIATTPFDALPEKLQRGFRKWVGNPKGTKTLEGLEASKVSSYDDAVKLIAKGSRDLESMLKQADAASSIRAALEDEVAKVLRIYQRNAGKMSSKEQIDFVTDYLEPYRVILNRVNRVFSTAGAALQRGDVAAGASGLRTKDAGKNPLYKSLYKNERQRLKRLSEKANAIPGETPEAQKMRLIDILKKDNNEVAKQFESLKSSSNRARANRVSQKIKEYNSQVKKAKIVEKQLKKKGYDTSHLKSAIRAYDSQVKKAIRVRDSLRNKKIKNAEKAKMDALKEIDTAQKEIEKAEAAEIKRNVKENERKIKQEIAKRKRLKAQEQKALERSQQIKMPKGVGNVIFNRLKVPKAKKVLSPEELDFRQRVRLARNVLSKIKIQDRKIQSLLLERTELKEIQKQVVEDVPTLEKGVGNVVFNKLRSKRKEKVLTASQQEFNKRVKRARAELRKEKMASQSAEEVAEKARLAEEQALEKARLAEQRAIKAQESRDLNQVVNLFKVREPKPVGVVEEKGLPKSSMRTIKKILAEKGLSIENQLKKTGKFETKKLTNFASEILASDMNSFDVTRALLSHPKQIHKTVLYGKSPITGDIEQVGVKESKSIWERYKDFNDAVGDMIIGSYISGLHTKFIVPTSGVLNSALSSLERDVVPQFLSNIKEGVSPVIHKMFKNDIAGDFKPEMSRLVFNLQDKKEAIRSSIKNLFKDLKTREDYNALKEMSESSDQGVLGLGMMSVYDKSRFGIQKKLKEGLNSESIYSNKVVRGFMNVADMTLHGFDHILGYKHLRVLDKFFKKVNIGSEVRNSVYNYKLRGFRNFLPDNPEVHARLIREEVFGIADDVRTKRPQAQIDVHVDKGKGYRKVNPRVPDDPQLDLENLEGDIKGKAQRIAKHIEDPSSTKLDSVEAYKDKIRNNPKFAQEQFNKEIQEMSDNIFKHIEDPSVPLNPIEKQILKESVDYIDKEILLRKKDVEILGGEQFNIGKLAALMSQTMQYVPILGKPLGAFLGVLGSLTEQIVQRIPVINFANPGIRKTWVSQPERVIAKSITGATIIGATLAKDLANHPDTDGIRVFPTKKDMFNYGQAVGGYPRGVFYYNKENGRMYGFAKMDIIGGLVSIGAYLNYYADEFEDHGSLGKFTSDFITTLARTSPWGEFMINGSETLGFLADLENGQKNSNRFNNFFNVGILNDVRNLVLGGDKVAELRPQRRGDISEYGEISDRSSLFNEDATSESVDLSFKGFHSKLKSIFQKDVIGEDNFYTPIYNWDGTVTKMPGYQVNQRSWKLPLAFASEFSSRYLFKAIDTNSKFRALNQRLYDFTTFGFSKTLVPKNEIDLKLIPNATINSSDIITVYNQHLSDDPKGVPKTVFAGMDDVKKKSQEYTFTKFKKLDSRMSSKLVQYASGEPFSMSVSKGTGFKKVNSSFEKDARQAIEQNILNVFNPELRSKYNSWASHFTTFGYDKRKALEAVVMNPHSEKESKQVSDVLNQMIMRGQPITDATLKDTVSRIMRQTKASNRHSKFLKRLERKYPELKNSLQADSLDNIDQKVLFKGVEDHVRKNHGGRGSHLSVISHTKGIIDRALEKANLAEKFVYFHILAENVHYVKQSKTMSTENYAELKEFYAKKRVDVINQIVSPYNTMAKHLFVSKYLTKNESFLNNFIKSHIEDLKVSGRQRPLDDLSQVTLGVQ